MAITREFDFEHEVEQALIKLDVQAEFDLNSAGEVEVSGVWQYVGFGKHTKIETDWLREIAEAEAEKYLTRFYDDIAAELDEETDDLDYEMRRDDLRDAAE